MADVNANIGVHIETSAALVELKNLQRQLATFHSSVAKGSTQAAAVQKNLQTNLLNSINATGQFAAQMVVVRSSTEAFTHALETNKLTMREYFRFAGGSTKTFGKLFRQEFDTIAKVAEERVKKMQTQYIKMGRDANGAVKAISIMPKTLDMKDYATQTAIAAQKQALFNQLLKQGSTSLLNFGKNTQWAGRQLMVGFTVPLAYFGTMAAKTFMDLETQAIKFKRVYGDMFTTSNETNKALDDVRKLAEEFTKYGVAVTKTMEMAASAAAMGKTGADLTAQVAEATRLAVLGGVEQEQALETTISLTNAFGTASEDLAKKINFLNSVENQTVVSIEDLTIAIPKAGPVVKQLGGDVEDLAFFLTAMKEGGINASEGANALKSGLAALINPTGKAAEMLATFGVNINAIVEGNQGNVRQTVIDFSKALDTLDPLNRARAIEQLFGKFQFSRLSTLFQNVTKDGTQAARVLELAGASMEELAILSERELKTLEDAVGTNFKAAVEELKVAIAPIGKTFLEAVTPIVKVVGDILDKFNNLGDGTKKFIVIATTLVGLIGPTLLMTFGLLANGVANIIKLFMVLRGGFLRLGGNSKILAEQTTYLNAEQLEATTIAASLNQAHTRLTQSFTAEATAVRLLRQAYIDATFAASKFAAANPGMMVPGYRGKAPKKMARGTTGLPGPKGAGDIIPILGAPGEAIIPSDTAQDPRYKPIIEALVAGNLKGYDEGTNNLQADNTTGSKPKQVNSEVAFSHITGGADGQGELRTIRQLYDSGEFKGSTQQLLKSYIDAGMGELTQRSYTSLGFDIDKDINARLAGKSQKGKRKAGVLTSDYLTEIQKPGAINTMVRLLIKNGTLPAEAIDTADKFRKDYIAKIQASELKEITDRDLVKMTEEVLATKKHAGIRPLSKLNVTKRPTTSDIGDFLNKQASASEELTYKEAKKLLEKEKLNVGPELDKDFEKNNNKLKIYRGKDGKIIGVDSLTSDGKLTHRGAVIGGGELDLIRTKGAERQGGYRDITQIKEKKDLQTTLTSAQEKQITKNLQDAMDREKQMIAIDKDIRKSPEGKQEPTKYGKQIAPTTGYSFTANRALGGVYEGPDGKKVFVKPVLDARAALAEQRATQIAREVHGLQAPEQRIKTMLDPTDPTGQRKLIVLESDYDERFNPSKMDKGFSKEQYVRQLIAATLRADSDLKKGNLGGNIIADVGASGVFGKASGPREYAMNLPSMEDMAIKNLSGVKGDSAGRSPFWFSNETAELARGMTSKEYKDLMVAEINRVLPLLEKKVKAFNFPPGSDESKVYNAMIERLREGKKADWEKIHKQHTSILVKPDELVQDKKTKKLEKPKTRGKRAGTKSTSGSSKDTRIMEKPGKDKQIVQGTKTPTRAKRLVGRAYAPNAEEAQTGVRLSEVERQFQREQNSLRRKAAKNQRDLRRIEKNKIAKEKKYGPFIKQDPVDKSIRRNQDKRQKDEQRAYKAELKARRIQEKALQDYNEILKDSTKAQMTSKQKVQEFSHRTGMAVGAMSGITVAASFAGGKVGEMAQTIMPFVFGLQGIIAILPALMNPWFAAIAAISAFAIAFKLIDSNNKKMAAKQLEYINSISATTANMQKVGEITGKVGASQQMAEKRKSGSFGAYNDAQRADQMFGDKFLKSDIGKSMAQGFVDNMKLFGSQQAASDFALQLSTYVSDGVLTSDQAAGIAEQIGIQLGSTKYTVEIQGNLRSIIGPNGEDLAKDPLRVRTQIINKATARTDKELGSLASAQAEYGLFGSKSGATEAARIAAFAGNNLEIIKAQVDATELLYQKQIDSLNEDLLKTTNLKKQLELKEKIAKLESDQKTDLAGFNNTFSNELSKQLKVFNEKIANEGVIGKDAQKEAAYFNSLKGSVKDTYKGTAFEKSSEDALSKLAKLSDKTVNPFDDKTKGGFNTQREAQSFEVQMSLLMKNKVINPEQTNALLDLFAGKLPQLQQSLTLGIRRQGPEKTIAMLDFFNSLDIDKGRSIKISTQIINSDPETFNKIGEALASLQVLDGSEVNMSAYLDSDDAYARLVALGNKLAIVEKMPSPITKKSIMEYEEKGGLLGTGVTKSQLEILISKWQDFDALPDELQKEAISKFITIYETKFADEASKRAYMAQEAGRMAEKAGGSSFTKDAEFNRLMALGGTDPTALSSEFVAAQVQSYIGDAKTPVKGVGKGSGSGGTKDRKTTPFDDMLQDLKRTRKATIDAQGGAKELMSILGQGKNIKAFNGIDQQLSKIGANSDFINFVGGLDNAVKENIITIKDGVVSYGLYGKAAKKAFDEIELGSFSAKTAQAITELQAQRSAFVSLKAAGLESADALDLISDSSFALSLNSAANAEEVKKIIADYKTLKAETAKTLEFTNPEEAFRKLKDEASEYYDFLEKEARAATKPEMDRLNDLIDKNNKLIEVKEREIELQLSRPTELLNRDLDLMDKAAESINNKYDTQAKALSKISDINKDIADQEQKRLTLADALSQGDISAAAVAAQDMRNSLAESAMEKSSSALEAAKEYELANLRNSSGLTRVQIEEKIYELEQKKLQATDAIRELQDQNYKTQKENIEPLQEALDKQIKSIDAARIAFDNQSLSIQKTKFEAELANGKFSIAEGIVGRVKALWDGIVSKSVTLTVNQNGGGGGGSGGGGSGGGGNGTPGTTFKDPNKEILQAISEGVALMTEAEMVRAMNRGSLSMGGLVPKYFANGGLSKGTDTVPAMLTPGEFVMRKSAVDKFGPLLSAMNSPSFKMSKPVSYNPESNGRNSVVDNSGAMYNYNIGITVPQSNANSGDIANAVISQIKYIDAQRIRGQK